jgi:predicted Zn-dependent protease
VAHAWKDVAPEKIEDAGAVYALFSADLLPETRLDDDTRMHALAKKLTELLDRNREAAIFRLQTALHLASDTELRAAVQHLQAIYPGCTRLAELDLARLGRESKADELAARAEEFRQTRPDAFLGPYYAAYARALKGDRSGAIDLLQSYVDRLPEVPIVEQALATLRADANATPAQVFTHRNEVLFPEQFDADDVTGQLRFSPR